MEWVIAAIGVGLIVVAVRRARTKGAAASLQMAAGGFLLTGAAATGLVDFLFFDLLLNPIGWLGIGMLALAGVLFAGGQALEKPRKAEEVEGSKKQVKESKGKSKRKAVEPSNDADDDLSDIQDILKRHGIE
jgi:hypothetical protein